MQAAVPHGLPVLALTCAISAAALAHGEAEWIQKNPDFVDRFGYHCCGPNESWWWCKSRQLQGGTIAGTYRAAGRLPLLSVRRQLTTNHPPDNRVTAAKSTSRTRAL